MKGPVWVILSTLLFAASCTPNGPGSAGFDEASMVADGVVGGNLMPLVRQLCDAHAGDVPVPHDGFEPKDLFPADRLTRDSAVGVVVSALSAMGYTLVVQSLGDGPLPARNVIAEWRGNARAHEVVLVASHLDAFYAGADDNGSAVAAMLEVARVVRQHRFSRTIRFVSFDLEEFGSIGSARYISAGHASDVVSAIVMDMVGYASTRPGSQKDVAGIRLPDVGDYLIVAGNDASASHVQRITAFSHSRGVARVQGVIAPGDGTYFLSSVFMRSDHGLLWYRGIPSVFFTDGANFRNPHYHRPSDTPETLDAAFLERNTRLLAAAVALLAEVQP